MNRRWNWERAAVTAAGLLGVAVAVAVLVVLFGPVADRATPHDKDRAAAVNATRQILLATAAGAAALVGLGFTARTFYLGRRGQLTDRYARAIGQLASPTTTERLGGVYALEHLMRESPRDHETVTDVLAAFIRERTRTHPASQPATSSKQQAPTRPATDVEAAVAVLRRRPRRPEANPLDLSNTNLRGADLNGAWLFGADLSGAALQAAKLYGAELRNANLSGAGLEGADLTDARLQRAQLEGAHLRGASLMSAELQDADFEKADLRGALLDGAVLQNANLEAAQLQGADLRGADLRGAFLAHAQLTGAMLAAAMLHDAFLDDAQFHSANLDRAQFCQPGTESVVRLYVKQLEGALITTQTVIPNELRAGLPDSLPDAGTYPGVDHGPRVRRYRSPWTRLTRRILRRR